MSLTRETMWELCAALMCAAPLYWRRNVLDLVLRRYPTFYNFLQGRDPITDTNKLNSMSCSRFQINAYSGENIETGGCNSAGKLVKIERAARGSLRPHYRADVGRIRLHPPTNKSVRK